MYYTVLVLTVNSWRAPIKPIRSALSLRPKKLDRDNSQLPPTGTANGGMSLSTTPHHEHTCTQNHTITSVIICIMHISGCSMLQQFGNCAVPKQFQSKSPIPLTLQHSNIQLHCIVAHVYTVDPVVQTVLRLTALAMAALQYSAVLL